MCHSSWNVDTIGCFRCYNNPTGRGRVARAGSMGNTCSVDPQAEFEELDVQCELVQKPVFSCWREEFWPPHKRERYEYYKQRVRNGELTGVIPNRAALLDAWAQRWARTAQTWRHAGLVPRSETPV